MGKSAYGITLVGASAGAIGEVMDVTFSGAAREAHDTSTHGTTGGDGTFEPSGIKDHGEVAIELQYDKTIYATVQGLIDDDPEVWTVTYPDTSTDVFTAFATGTGSAFPHAGLITQTLTLKLTGDRVITPVV